MTGPSAKSANRRKEAELEIKELAIQQKAEGERELSKLRQELHERERLLDKRQDALEQQAEQLRKQEKMVESTQRKLAERIEDANRRNEELAKLLDLQRQTLHAAQRPEPRRSHAAAAGNARQRTAARSGALIIKHEKKLAEICEAKAARDAAHLRSSATPPPTRPKPPPARSIFPTTK